MGNAGPSMLRLAIVLTVFFVAGSAMTFVIWYTLSEFLAGRAVEGGQYLLALALLGVFVCLAWLLAHYLRGLMDQNGREER